MKNNNTQTVPDGWRETTLGSVVDITSSKRIFHSDYVSSGVPFYRSKEIIEKQKGSNVSQDLYITEKKFEGIDRMFGSPKEDDLLLTSVGTLGVPYLVKSNERFYFKDGNLTWFKKYKGLVPAFLYYWLLSPVGKAGINSITIGSTQSAITIMSLKAMPILLPEPLEQQAIAYVLSSFDDKIELLREQNKTLETMAQALFKHWFVDFEFPNKDGKPYKSSGGKMGDSELGEIPDGWKVGSINDLVNIRSGFAFKSIDFISYGKFGLVTIRNVQDGHFVENTTDRLETLPEKMPDCCLLTTGDILLSLTGNVGRICYVVGNDYVLNQRVAKLEAEYKNDVAFTYLLFRQNALFSAMLGLSSGTAQQNLSPIKTGEIDIIIPTRGVLDGFGGTTNKMLLKMFNNSEQIQALAKTRDTLLPKLMRGDVRVKI